MARIFITYNRASSDAVAALADDLALVGHQVWFDKSITGGQQWWNEILDNIRQCDLLIFALSRESVQSHACLAEFDYASGLERGVLPLLVADGVQTSLLPRRLGEIQHIDYRNRDLRAGLALSRAITGLRPAPPLPDPLPEPPPVPMSYLNDLKDQVESTAKLSFQEQAALLFELKGQLEESDAREAVLDLLRRMRRRDDLLARLASEIDAMLAQAMPPSSAKKPRSKAAPIADEAPVAAPAEAAPPAREPSAIVPSSDRIEGEADEIARILLRVVERKESWLLGDDPKNQIRVDPLAGDGETAIIATATCRDDVSSTKANALKKHGWKANDSTADAVLGAAAGAALLYATSGLGAVALLSKKVRDYMMTVEMRRTWQPGTTRRRLILVGEELWQALQTIAPELRIVPMKQLAQPGKGAVACVSS